MEAASSASFFNADLKEEQMTSQRPSELITAEVTSWPGISAGPGRRGEFAFKVAGREIGHLHGGHAAHFGGQERGSQR
jgi:hypothetical protein